MKGHRIWLAVAAMAALVVAPAQAEDFWDSLKKDFKGLTGAIKEGIDDIAEGKKEVEEVVDDARQLQEELTGNEPRYDPAWVAELQQRLTAQGFDPGPVDGAFGDRTSRAIADFQRQAGISPDGLPRPSVMRAVRARTQGVQTAQPWPQAQSGGDAAPFSGSTAAPALTSDPTGQASFETSPPGQVSSVSTGSQDATYARFLEAHLALHPEVAEDDAFALQYLSYLPAGRIVRSSSSCSTGASSIGSDSSRRSGRRGRRASRRPCPGHVRRAARCSARRSRGPPASTISPREPSR